MAISALTDHRYSLTEYLDLEDAAEKKSEFHAGYIVAMAAGSEPHSRIASRMNAILNRYLRTCRIYDSSLKFYIEAAARVFYPDAMALCSGHPQFVEGRDNVITNPSLVVEVLSPSSERRDRGTEWDYYRSVPSVEHILLVAQDVVQIDHIERQSKDRWTITRYQSNATILIFEAAIPVKEIYDGILDRPTA
jgi:Uma2 family endonuclease